MCVYPIIVTNVMNATSKMLSFVLFGYHVLISFYEWKNTLHYQ